MKYVYLIAAIALSVAAAFMSVVGLNKIFPGVLWPFIILEGVKFVAAVYMHNHWKDMGLAMRSYMVAGVGVLMIMTSAGIYGYLSNSAMSHTTSTVQEQTKVDFLNDSVKNFEQRRAELVAAKDRLDKVVDGYAGLADPNAAVRSATVFSRQKAQRAEIDAEIATIDASIASTKTELVSRNAQLATVRAEIGPGVYLANALYGESSMNTIEKAIQIVILLIVFTFDPMAVVMMINAAKMFEKKEQEIVPQVQVAQAVAEPVVKPKRKYTRKKKEENVIAPDSHVNQSAFEPVDLSILSEPVEPTTVVEPAAEPETVAKRRTASKLRKRQQLIDEAIQRVELPA